QVEAAAPPPAGSAAPPRLAPTALGTLPVPRPLPGPPLVRVHVLGYLPELLAEGVVPAAGLRVGQDVVRLGDLLEPLGRGGVGVEVGMVGAGQAPVRPLDVLLGRGTRYAEHLVEVPAHRPHPRSEEHTSELQSRE